LSGLFEHPRPRQVRAYCLTDVIQAGDGQIALPVWAVVLGMGLALGGGVIGAVFLVLRRRRWTRISEH
jgi:hypothetical protein